ncbi:hypothetical protein [Flavobacterium marginilacus]|uniref:hypothetical protein n=1 Tax=Flavobacterium marginilacus TaxID=3003256 RepID=UPI00248EC1DF|nr:hypothetical protein [Flavobacterium marginilacus]
MRASQIVTLVIYYVVLVSFVKICSFLREGFQGFRPDRFQNPVGITIETKKSQLPVFSPEVEILL